METFTAPGFKRRGPIKRMEKIQTQKSGGNVGISFVPLRYLRFRGLLDDMAKRDQNSS